MNQDGEREAENDDNHLDFKDPIHAKNIIIHKDYDESTKLHFDIAIVELSKPIDLLKHADVIHPICLPKDNIKLNIYYTLLV